MVIETVVENYDLAQVHRELIDDVVEASVSLATLGAVIEVRSVQRRIRGDDLLRRRVGLGHIVPDLAGNGGPGVGGEGGATFGIEVLDGVPESDASSLEEFGVGKGTTPLTTDDGVNEAFVVGQAWPATCRGRG